MAFQAIAVRQYKSDPLTAQGANPTIALDSAVAAGSTLLLIGAAYRKDTGQTTLLNSVADGTNTWGTPTNVRSSGSYSPNVFCAIAENVSAGSPTVTATLNQAASNFVSWSLIEIEKCVTSSGVMTPVTGTASSGTTTSTAATGALAQTDNLVVVCAGGYFGTPSNPSGFTSLLTQMNNGAYVGAQVSYKTVTATDSLTGTVTHDATSGSSALLVVIKAATAGSALHYKFQLDASAFTSADTGITGFVWRNATPDAAAAQRFTGLAGDANAGDLIIATGLPSGIAVSDTLYGIFYNGNDTSGLIAGVVEAA